MSEPLGERMAELRGHVQADYGHGDVELGLAGLKGRLRRRQRASYVVGALSLVAALFVVARLWGPAQESLQAGSTVRTRDGSIARQLSSETELALQYERDDEVSLALRRGHGHFEVTRKPGRRYRVRAGEVDIEVLGTAFEVNRRGARTHVRVEHGLVRVGWAGGHTLLRAGESGLFPPPPNVARVPEGTRAAEPVAATAGLEAAASPEALPSAAESGLEEQASERSAEPWRALARAGKHREAFGSLGQRPVLDLSGLLLAADAARLSGHPREAAAYLERLVERYPRSASARLAAFTLGRLALHELDEPVLAARSFARAYALDPQGPLAEDALVREAEAYQRAGQNRRARSAAARYIERFPHGVRRAEMSRYLARAPEGALRHLTP